MIKIDYLSGKKAKDVSNNVIFEAFIKNSFISKNKDVIIRKTFWEL